jgi:hypothetical protein
MIFASEGKRTARYTSEDAGNRGPPPLSRALLGVPGSLPVVPRVPQLPKVLAESGMLPKFRLRASGFRRLFGWALGLAD